MKLITVAREFKISDGNYGNTTQQMSFSVPPEMLQDAVEALDTWELCERRIASFKKENDIEDPDDLPNKLFRQYERLQEQKVDAFMRVKNLIEELAQREED